MNRKVSHKVLVAFVSLGHAESSILSSFIIGEDTGSIPVRLAIGGSIVVLHLL